MDGAIAHRFTHHPPKDAATAGKHAVVRETIGDAATVLADRLPEGREKSLALTKLEEAMFWANAAIARNQA